MTIYIICMFLTFLLQSVTQHLLQSLFTRITSQINKIDQFKRAMISCFHLFPGDCAAAWFMNSSGEQRFKSIPLDLSGSLLDAWFCFEVFLI